MLGIFVMFYYELDATLDVEFLIMFSILKKAWLLTVSLMAFVIPTLSILTIWILIAVHLKYTVDTTDRKGRKSFMRITAIMGTITTGILIKTILLKLFIN